MVRLWRAFAGMFWSMRISFPKVTCSPGFLPYLALLLLSVPLRVLGALGLAACVHEAFHLLALWLFGDAVEEISVGILGAKIKTGPLLPLQEFFCALSGPLGGFSLLLFARWMPLTALFGLIQSVFNLIPVYPMDGGRAVGILKEIILAKWPFVAYNRGRIK